MKRTRNGRVSMSTCVYAYVSGGIFDPPFLQFMASRTSFLRNLNTSKTLSEADYSVRREFTFFM